jgi:MFS family permease
MALAAALLGWMFDGAEMGIFSLIGGDAMAALMPTSAQGDRDLWFNIIMASFLVGAATGGVVFGWLGDRIGRVRAMTLSVLTYALFTGLCGFAGTATQVGILRFIASLGMGGEWSLGVALVMEVWPNKSRAFMAGLIGAAANVGYLLVGIIGLVLLDWLADLRSLLLRSGVSEATAESLVGHSGWRLVMMLGTLPAFLTFFIRIFVPESEKWKKEQGSGSTSNWATQDLLGVIVGAAGPGLIVALWAWDNPPWGPDLKLPIRMVGTLVGLAIATAGYTYPVLRYLQRQAANSSLVDSPRFTLKRMMLAACLSGVALLGTWGTTQQTPTWAKTLAEDAFKKQQTDLVAQDRAVDANKLVKPKAKEHALIWVSAGAIIGTILAALAGDWFGRRPAYFLLCLLSMFSVWALYLGNTSYGTAMLAWTFIAGLTTASFYGWLPLYLPELFRTSVRATGQGFGFNFGRILAAVGVLQLGNLLKNLTVDWHIGSWELPHGGRPIACSLIALIYLVGMVIIWFAPETRGKPLPE